MRLATSCFYLIIAALQTKAACVESFFDNILRSMGGGETDQWFVYIVECQDSSLYTGVAKDVQSRIDQHNSGKGAKYTRGRGPVILRASGGPHTKSQALSFEAQIKRQPSHKKTEALLDLSSNVSLP